MVKWAVGLLKSLQRSKLMREGFWSFVLRAAYVSLAFATTVILARVLGAEDYGIYSYAYALIMLIAIPVHTGLPNLILRETAKGLAKNRPDLVKGVWLWSGIASAVFLIAILGIIGPLFVGWQGGMSSATGRAVAYALVLAPALAYGNMVGAALRGMKCVILGQLPEFIIRPVTFFILIITVAYFFSKQLYAPTTLMLYAVAALVAVFAGVGILLQQIPPAVRAAKPTVKKREWLISGTLFALIAGFSAINNQASIIILGYYKNPDQVGVYSVATQVARLASFGLQVANMVSAPRIARLYALGETAKLQQLATASARAALLFSVFLITPFVVLGQAFFHLVFGPEFSASYTPLLILLVGQLINSAVGSVGYILNMTGHEKDMLQGIAVAAGINVLLNLALVPECGNIGSAISMSLSMMTWNIYLWWKVYNIVGINSFIINTWRKP